MAREIISKTWCDPCMAREERVEGVEHTITIGNQKPRVLAVCPVHEKEFVTPVLEALAEYAAPADRVRTKPGKAEAGSGTGQPWSPPSNAPLHDPDHPCKCAYPGCNGTSTTDNGLAQHVYKFHNITKKQHDQLASGETTIKKLGLQPYVAPPPLPDPLPCVGCVRTFTGPNRKGARAGHIVRQHPGVELPA